MDPNNHNVPSISDPSVNEPPPISFDFEKWNLTPPNINIDYNNFECLIENREKDEIFINAFIDRVLQELPEDQKNVEIKAPKLNDLVTKIYNMNESLKNLTVQLSNNYQDENWHQKKEECIKIRDSLDALRKDLLNPEYKRDFVSQVKKQKQRQLRRKQRRILWGKHKQFTEFQRKEAHAEIDEWIKRKKYDIDKEIEENEARKNADCILEGVKTKRADSKKYLELLQELENLRKVKTTIAKARGEKISAEGEVVFSNVVSKLLHPWKILDKEYALEEKGLKAMIASDLQEEVTKSTKNMIEEWTLALFNDKNYKKRVDNMDMKTFIEIRRDWDKYANPEEGSDIPIGWVLPPEPSSADWSKYVENRKENN